MLRCAWGCGPIPTSRKGYFEHHTALEVMESYHDVLNGDTLHAWRKEAGRDHHMILDANRWLTLDPMDERGEGPFGHNLRDVGLFQVTDANLDIWKKVDAQARALHANVVLFRTPASFTPSRQNLNNLERFRKEIVGEVPYQIAWEARGMWDPEEMDELAAANNMIVARDPWSEFEFLEPPSSDIIYIASQPRGRRNFDRDDMAEFVEYLEDHAGHVTVIFRGSDRKRHAFAFGNEVQRVQASAHVFQIFDEDIEGLEEEEDDE